MRHQQKNKNKIEGMAGLFDDNADPKVRLAQALQEIVDLKAYIKELESEVVRLEAVNIQHCKDKTETQGKMDVMQCKIDKQGVEIRKLLNLPGEKGEVGRRIFFSLLQIVDYAKDCVEWNDAKVIMAMLYRKLHSYATDEEYKLVDSIHDVFKKRYYGNHTNYNVAGDVVMKKETNIDKNYGPNIEQKGGTLQLPDKSDNE